MSGLNIRDDMIMVDIACNDPNNGLFAGRAEQISLGYDLLELEPRRSAPKFIELPSGFRLAGKSWHSPESKYGVGNWCWNGYWMKTRHVACFLTWLHARKLFTVSSGESRLFSMWQSEKPFDDSDREFIWRLVGKPSSHKF